MLLRRQLNFTDPDQHTSLLIIEGLVRYYWFQQFVTFTDTDDT